MARPRSFKVAAICVAFALSASAACESRESSKPANDCGANRAIERGLERTINAAIRAIDDVFDSRQVDAVVRRRLRPIRRRLANSLKSRCI